ncbi:hypothetical protein [Acinetobacter sp.]|uniref:hypothetical protein n=1 Tax=Acinetobacter sp. TaxID=472 RepID=UPI003D081DB1
MGKYIFVLEADSPPQFFLGDKIGNATIVEMKKEELPNRVTAAWLAERFNLSRKTIIEKVGVYNKGDENKHLYDPKQVIPVLENLNLLGAKRNSRRKT